jgi:hypothetical protein
MIKDGLCRVTLGCKIIHIKKRCNIATFASKIFYETVAHWDCRRGNVLDCQLGPDAGIIGAALAAVS